MHYTSHTHHYPLKINKGASGFYVVFVFICGSGSSVGIATLRAGRSGIEFRWGRDFPPFQTGPRSHPASCKMGTGSIPGVKCGRGLQEEKNSMTARVSMLLKSRASLTCFRACFLPGRAKDLSARR